VRGAYQKPDCCEGQGSRRDGEIEEASEWSQVSKTGSGPGLIPEEWKHRSFVIKRVGMMAEGLLTLQKVNRAK